VGAAVSVAEPVDWIPLADTKAQAVVCLRCGLVTIDDPMAWSLHDSLHFLLDRLAQRMAAGEVDW
jgi:hypothetical protein